MRPNIDKDIIPGTAIVYETKNVDLDTQTLVLVPEPSDDPHDPLNWSPTWKTVIILNQFVFVFVSIMTPLSIAPLTQIFMVEFELDRTQVNMLFGAVAITLGYANFITVPAANVFGRRITMIVSAMVCIGANIWAAQATSYGSFIGARCLSGLGAAANESLMPMVIEDLLFVHHRGRAMTLYFWAYAQGSYFGPIISGSVGATIGWRWFFNICAILQGFSLVLILVAHPETKFKRNRESPQMVINNHAVATEGEASVPDKGRPDTQIMSRTHSHSPLAAYSALNLNVVSNGRPSKEQFSIVPRARFWRGWGSVAEDMLSPLKIMTYPIVLWASFAIGFAANSMLALNLTQAQVFGAPPYSFSPAQIGFVNFALVGGAAVGLLTAGPLSDKLALHRAIRNNGVLEAEMRLPAMIPYVCLLVIGMVITAVGYQRSWAWQIVVIVGYSLVGLQAVAIPGLAMSYAVDSYKSLPGEIMIAATIVKNTFGFGMVFYFSQWATSDGYLAPLLTMMAIAASAVLLGLALFIPFGKTFRRWTMKSKVHAM